MEKIKTAGVPALFVALFAGFLGYIWGVTRPQREQTAHAQPIETPIVNANMAQDEKPKASPTSTLPDPNIYFPGTEAIGPDEMRVIACGTGMPTARESQAATCWLVELGNGDKFIFDAGTGSASRMASLHIPYDYLNKIFLSHLHTDHFGDFPAYFIGGWVAGRQHPLHVYGPAVLARRPALNMQSSICKKP